MRRCFFVCWGINSVCCEIATINTKELLLLANEVSLNRLNLGRKFVYEQVQHSTVVRSAHSVSVCFCVYLSVCIYLSIHPSIYLSVCLYLSICLSICLPVCVSIYLSVCVYLSIYLSTFCSLCDRSIKFLSLCLPCYVYSINYTKGMNCLKIGLLCLGRHCSALLLPQYLFCCLLRPSHIHGVNIP